MCTHPALRRGLCIALLAGLLSCADTGVVGVNADCAQACDKDHLCHPSLAICVGCASNPDCTSHDHGDKPYCDGARFECVQCRDQNDCHGSTKFCVQGECRTCERDDDCSAGEQCGKDGCTAKSRDGGKND